MALAKPLDAARPSVTILGGIVLLGFILYIGRALLIPFALAILLTFILAPAVVMLQRRGVSKGIAVVAVSLTAIFVIACTIFTFSSQLHALASDLPSHKENIKRKIRDLQGEEPGALSRLVRMADELLAVAQSKPDSTVAIPVMVTQQKNTEAELYAGAAGKLVGLISSIGLVIGLTMTMLIRREDLRDRLLRLAGHSHIASTTRAMDEAAKRISRYLVLQLAVNAGFGLVYGIGLSILGVPYALMWGTLATILRFIPYIGTWMSAALPVLVSVAVFQGWAQPVLVVGLTLVLGIFTNNILEPMLISRTTGLSPVALVVAAAFWTWLWGPVGLILSTPMTVCMGVLGRYVPPLQFLDVLVGTEPALDQQHVYFHRLLSRNEIDAAEVLSGYLETHTGDELCDDVLLPTLVRLKEDFGRGKLTQEEADYVVEATDELLDDLDIRPPADEEADESAPSEPEPELTVLCCSAKDQIDELSSRIFRDVTSSAVQVQPVKARTSLAELFDQVRTSEPTMLMIVAVHPGGLARVRYLCKQLHHAYPALPIAVAYWGLPVESKLGPQLRALGAEYVATTMAESLEHVELIAKAAAAVNNVPVNPPALDVERVDPYLAANVAAGPTAEM